MSAQEQDTKLDGTTHAEGCWTWGLKHYGCALARIEWLELAQKTNQQTVIRQAHEIRRLERDLARLESKYDDMNDHRLQVLEDRS